MLMEKYNSTPMWVPYNGKDSEIINEVIIPVGMSGGRKKKYKKIIPQTYYTETFEEEEPTKYLQPVYTRFMK